MQPVFCQKMHANMNMLGVSTECHNSNNNIKDFRFMQPLTCGFLDDFSIPVAFLKHFEVLLVGRSLESVLLMTEKQPDCHWFINVQDGRFFKDGWKEFCDHLHVKLGDFLVFTLKTPLVFQVSAYDPLTACQRHSPSLPKAINQGSRTTDELNSKKTQKTKIDDKAAAANENPSEKAEFPCYRVTITPSCFKRSLVYLPQRFIRSSGLERRRCFVKLIYKKQNPRIVKLICRKSDGHANISQGWKEFLTTNNIKPKSVLSFQLIENGRCPVLKVTPAPFPTEKLVI